MDPIEEGLLQDCKENKAGALEIYSDWLIDSDRSQEAEAVRKGIASVKVNRFEDLLGKILVHIDHDEQSLRLHTSEGKKYLLYHEQDCCESVTIEDIQGNLDDLIGYPLLLAEEVVSTTNPPGYVPFDYQDSFTWTFYKFATIKGYVTVRWYGESNGSYSESVDFKEVKK